MPALRPRAGAPPSRVKSTARLDQRHLGRLAPPRPAYGARRKMPGLLRRRAARSQAARRLRARISLDGAAAVRLILEAWRALPPRRFLHKCRIVISSCMESSNSSADCHAAARKPGAAMHAALWPIRCLRPASMNSRARRPSGCRSHAIGSLSGRSSCALPAAPPAAGSRIRHLPAAAAATPAARGRGEGEKERRRASERPRRPGGLAAGRLPCFAMAATGPERRWGGVGRLDAGAAATPG